MASGQSLTIENGAIVYIADSQFLSVSGQFNVTGASVVIDKNAGCCGTSDGDRRQQRRDDDRQRTPPSTATAAAATRTPTSQVSTGGHLIASDSTFSLDNLYLNTGLVLNSGDLTDNVFNTPLYAPIADQPLLTNNQSFDAVYLTGGLNSGQSLSLDPIGTQTTAGQYYVLPNGLAVASGQALTIENDAMVYIADSQFLSVSGQLNVTARRW